MLRKFVCNTFCKLSRAISPTRSSLGARLIASSVNNVAPCAEEDENPVPGTTAEDSEIQYNTIDESSHSFCSMMVNLKNRRKRYQKGQILLEGRRIIQDALLVGLKPNMILFSKKDILMKMKLPHYCYSVEHTVLYKMTYSEMQTWSDLTTPPGIIGIFAMPDLSRNAKPIGALPVTVVGDNIREPGNLGAILRTCSALPCSKILLTQGCVDIWNSKVIRASCGGFFHVPIEHNVSWERIAEHDGNVVAADVMEPGMLQTEDDKKKKSLSKKIPLLPYFGVDYNELAPLILILGGETEGLSREAAEFIKSRKGVSVNIPLSNYVESLNSGTALGVITFEIKRQIMQSLLKDSMEAT